MEEILEEGLSELCAGAVKRGEEIKEMVGAQKAHSVEWCSQVFQMLPYTSQPP